jgi:hypothetical protein
VENSSEYLSTFNLIKIVDFLKKDTKGSLPAEEKSYIQIDSLQNFPSFPEEKWDLSSRHLIGVFKLSFLGQF